MSQFTTEVRYICETYAGNTVSQGYPKVSDIIQAAIPKVFDFDFPIFDERYRNVLETKILMHYYTREIGLETVGLWKLKLMTKLNEIMPYYNQLYKSTLLEFNPLYDVDITRQRSVTNNGNNDTQRTNTVNEDTSANSTVNNTIDGEVKDDSTINNTQTTTKTNNSSSLYSDTPQGTISDLQSNTYLTNATINSGNDNEGITGNQTNAGTTNTSQTNDTETDSTTERNIKTNENTNTTMTNTETYLESVSGKQGTQSYSSIIMEYRKTFLNIDMMVIEELEPLFFGLWE